MKNSVRLSILVLVSLLASCSRKEAEKLSTVTFTLPQVATNKSSSAKLMGNTFLESITSNSVSTLTETPNWGLTDPAATSEIGCYAIYVGGNEPDHKSRMCLVGKDTTIAKKIEFGPFFGLYPAGAAVEIEVKPGSRTIHLVGMKKGSQPCQALNASNNSQLIFSNYSNPLLLASQTVEIKSGINNISLTSQISNLEGQKVGYCNMMDDGQSVPANSFQIIGHNRFGIQSCNKQIIQLATNTPNMRVFNDFDQVFTYNSPATDGGLIYSDINCTQQISSLTIPKGSLRGEFFYKNTDTTIAAGSVNLPEPTRQISFNSNLVGNQSKTVFLRSNANQTIGSFQFLNDGNRINGGECRNADFFVLDQQGYSMVMTTAWTWNADLKGKDGVNLYNGSVSFVNNCIDKIKTPNEKISNAITMSPGTSIGRLFILGTDVNSNPVDFRLGVNMTAPATLSGYTLWNVSPMFDNLSLQFSKDGTNYTSTVPQVFASDCLRIKAVAMKSGSPFAMPSFANYNLNFDGFFGADIYKNSSCTSATDFDNRYSLVPGSISNESSIKFKKASIANSALRSRSIFTFNQAEQTTSIPVLWDPSDTPTSNADLVWFRPGASGTSWSKDSLFGTGLSDYLSHWTGGTSTNMTIGSANGVETVFFDTSTKKLSNNRNPIGSNYTISGLLNLNALGAPGDYKILFSLTGSSPTTVPIKIVKGATDTMFDLNGSVLAGNYLTTTWIFFSIKQSGTDLTLYVKGQNNYSGELTLNSITSRSQFVIGDSGTYSMIGHLATDLVFVDRALPTSERETLYNYYRNKYPSAGLP